MMMNADIVPDRSITAGRLPQDILKVVREKQGVKYSLLDRKVITYLED
jgi:hypothetical protein